MINRVLLLVSMYLVAVDIQHCHGTPSPARVAVVGGGAAGLTATWLLDRDYDVTLYEKADRLGGHACTVNVERDGFSIPMDLGLEFFNESLFPHFNNLLRILSVPVHKYDMVYTFYKTDGSDVIVFPPVQGDSVRWNDFIFHPLCDMVQFSHLLCEASELVDEGNLEPSLEAFVESLTLFSEFKDGFLYPFCAGAWGVSIDDVKTIKAYLIMKWLVKNRPEGMGPAVLHEMVGGMGSYVKAIASQFEHAQVRLSSTITTITYDGSLYTIVEADGSLAQYDHLIMATNANQAGELLSHIPEASQVLPYLNDVGYYSTTIALHGDERFMPPNKEDWGVVNLRYDETNCEITVHKPWRSQLFPIFRSWITFDMELPHLQQGDLPSPLYAMGHFLHPMPDSRYFACQEAIRKVQGDHNLWFAGVHTHDIDSHESAIMSAIKIVQRLAPSSERLQQLTTLDAES